MPQPKLSFDAALALALEACARQEQAALPSDAELRRLYPNLRRCDRRLRRALAERRRKEIRPRRVWPLRRVAVVAAACALLFAGALAPQADLFGAIYTALLQPDGRDYALRYTWEGEPAAATLPADCAPAYQPPGYTADRDAAITTETEYYRQYTRTSAGRYAPADFAALLPDVTLPAQAVGGYALNEIQVSWQPDPLARPGDRVLRRYRLAADNLQGAALTYADADGHTVRVNLIGLAALGGAPDADAEIRWSAEPVLRAGEAGQTVYGLDGTLRQPGGQAIIQLHAAAEDETAFLAAVAPFTEVTGWMASTL